MSNSKPITFAVSGNVRAELHASPASAIKSKDRWEALGFTARIYFVSETSDDSLVGLEVFA